jgi:UDP-2,3-diacylglucosamine hydrolase
MHSKPAFRFTLTPGQKIYFASDFHLGAPDYASSRGREQRIINWLNHIQDDAEAIFLLGDLFDFWFEYKYVVPKGFVRFLGKLASLKDLGKEIIIFTGNHDMWMFDYLEKELEVPIIRQPVSMQINEQLLHIGHGDGLGSGDRQFKFLKKIFKSPLSQKLFAAIHPRWGMGLAHSWSQHSRKKNLKKDESFKGKEFEWIYEYCVDIEQDQHHDYYIFGHRHLPLNIPIHENSRYFNIGEWITEQTYGVHDGIKFTLSTFKK